MKLKVLAVLLLLYPALAAAQVNYVAVTATVVDPNSNPYANAQVVATLVSAQGIPLTGGVFTPNGAMFNGSPARSTLSSTGLMSLNLVPNGTLTCTPACSGNQWRITISEPTDSAVLRYSASWNITYTTTITSAVDLSTQLSALAQPIAFINLKTGQSTVGASFPGVTPANNGLAMTGPVAAKNLAVSVLSFGAKCDGVTDDTAAFEAAWASINTAGGEIDLPAGTCYVPNGVKFNQTSPNSNTTRIIRGMGIWQTYIKTYNANIGIELGGVVNIILRDFSLQDTGSTAAVGIARYRPDVTQGYSGQCGGHTYENIGINGLYSIANLYSIACEVNDHRNLSMQNAGSGAVLAIDSYNVMGLTGMTMPTQASGASDTVNHFYGGEVMAYGTGPAVYFGNGSADDVTFNGTYFDVSSSSQGCIQFGGGTWGTATADNVQGTKSFHSVRFEGNGQAIQITASGVSPMLTIDSGSTFGTLNKDILQTNSTWTGGSAGLTGADIHGISVLGAGITLGNVLGSNISVPGDAITFLNNAYISNDHLEANSFSFPSNYVDNGSTYTKNDNTVATGNLKTYYGSGVGSTYGSTVIFQPFQAAPSNPVNGELATADCVHWVPTGCGTGGTLMMYYGGAWTAIGALSGSYLPVANPTATGTATLPTVASNNLNGVAGGDMFVTASSGQNLWAKSNSSIYLNPTGSSNPSVYVYGAAGTVYLILANTQSGGTNWYLGSNTSANLCIGTGGACTYKFTGAGAVTGFASLGLTNTSLDSNGLRHLAGTAPTASTGTITGSNEGGSVTGLSAATTLTLTFSNSGWTTWASCTANTSVSATQPYITAMSKTAVTFTFPSLTGTLYYTCTGN